MKKFAIFIIRIYQWTVAPIIGNTCRFTPSCSHYGLEAFQKHGFIGGCGLTLRRILRCNPWCEGGKDPVPEPGSELTHTQKND